MNDQFNQRNAAWRAAQQWRDRAKSQSRWRGPKLFLTWLVFGIMMLVGLVVALVFLLVGWLAMPFLRRRLRKRTEEMRARAEQGYQRARGDAQQREGNVIEGDYSVEDGEPAKNGARERR